VQSRHVERVSRPQSQLKSGTKMMLILGGGRAQDPKKGNMCLYDIV
jgi:hypothetical protein